MGPELEQTFVLIKPDAVANNWVEAIIKRYTDAGLEPVMIFPPITMTREKAGRFYKEHSNKPFYTGLTLAMSSGPVVGLILQGKDVVRRIREINGARDPQQAVSGTIRHDFMSAGGPFNTVHASDGVEAAKREIFSFLSFYDAAGIEHVKKYLKKPAYN
jgi:nucleoside-diphosphate kinase